MHGEKLIDAVNNPVYHKKVRQMLTWLRVFPDIRGVFYEKHIFGLRFRIIIQRSDKRDVNVFVGFLPTGTVYKIEYNTSVLRHYNQIFDINGPERMCYYRGNDWFDIYDYLGEYEDV